jgi:diadenosine tetraphosphatase ApaH/serine/threonine PP2A family protein phosphatase
LKKQLISDTSSPTPNKTFTTTNQTPMPKSKDSFFAIFSDIHANIDALTAVLTDIEQFPVRGMLCLGDIVGYGPEPASCVQRVMDTCAVTVLGNHEAMLFLTEKILDEDWDISIRKPLQLANEQLSKAQKSWLRDVPITADIDPITLSHASLNEPAGFHYIHDETEAEAHFAAQPTFISFNGHTHVPSLWEENPETFACRCYHPSESPTQLDPTKRYSVNVGSVGQPRDEDPRASYVLYDFEQQRLIHRRVPYDISRAKARFKKAGLPERNATRLAKGH